MTAAPTSGERIILPLLLLSLALRRNRVGLLAFEFLLPCARVRQCFAHLDARRFQIARPTDDAGIHGNAAAGAGMIPRLANGFAVVHSLLATFAKPNSDIFRGLQVLPASIAQELES